MSKIIFLADINFEASPKVRVATNEAVVNVYSEHYQAKKPMPPVVVFWDKSLKVLYLADGAHRCAAVAQVGRKGIEADLRDGTYEDALEYALTANSHHGLPRSNEDKRQCIMVAMKHWSKHSNASIAKMCDVDDKTVAAVRSELEDKQQIEPSKTRISSEGKEVSATRARKSEAAPKANPVEVGERDATGHPIPKAVLKHWRRSPEIKELLVQVSAIIGVIKRAQSSEDMMFCEVNCSAVIGDLDKAYIALKCAQPYAVCTTCQGHPETQRNGCRMCFGRGLISKFRWDRLAPEEIKKLRGAK